MRENQRALASKVNNTVLVTSRNHILHLIPRVVDKEGKRGSVTVTSKGGRRRGRERRKRKRVGAEEEEEEELKNLR